MLEEQTFKVILGKHGELSQPGLHETHLKNKTKQNKTKQNKKQQKKNKPKKTTTNQPTNKQKSQIHTHKIRPWGLYGSQGP